MAGGEIAEGHLVGAADARLQVMNGAGKAVRRQPLRRRIGLEEGAVDLFGSGCEDAMQANGVGHCPFTFVAMRPGFLEEAAL